jgi:hypothetical protein
LKDDAKLRLKILFFTLPFPDRREQSYYWQYNF